MIHSLTLPVLAVVAIVAALGTLSGLALMLMRPEAPDGWPLTKPPHVGGKHELSDAEPDAYRPRDWDAVTADPEPQPVDEPKTDDDPLPAEVIEPEPEPIELEPMPIDELDPRWDWLAHAEAEELAAVVQEPTAELVAA